MAGLVPAIHALFSGKDMDARHKAGHDKSALIAIRIIARQDERCRRLVKTSMIQFAGTF
jgi:hypothetical protein